MHGAHIPAAVGRGDIREDPFIVELRGAVRVRRARRETLGDRHARWVAIDSGRRREDNIEAPRVRHALDEVERALDIHLVVQQRLRDRLAHRLEPGEVDDRADVVLLEERRERLLVSNVDLVKDCFFPGELLDAA